MSEDSTVTGYIAIDPPIPWADLRGYPNLNICHSDHDVVIRVIEDSADTDDGVTITRRGVAIVPERRDQNGYHVAAHVQAIVEQFGAGRTFAGHIQVQWKGSDDPIESLRRIVVRDGRAVEVRPVLTWAEDAQ